jgi:hypothetical protein
MAVEHYTVIVGGVNTLIEELFGGGSVARIVKVKGLEDTSLVLEVVADVGFPREQKTIVLYHDVNGRKGKAVEFTMNVRGADAAHGGWV